MKRPRTGALAAVLATAAVVAGCGKAEAPRADAATERAQATERAMSDMYGTPVKAPEDAKNLGTDIDKKARDAVDNAEKSAK